MTKERVNNPILDTEGASDHIESQMQASSPLSGQMGNAEHVLQMGAKEIIRAHREEAPLASISYKEENVDEKISTEDIGRVMH